MIWFGKHVDGDTRAQVKLWCSHFLSPLGSFSNLAFDRYSSSYLRLLVWWGSSCSSTQFIRFCRRKHSPLWKMRIKSSCRKGWIGPQLMWLDRGEYMVCLAQCVQYHYGWVPYGQANVASYQNLIQIASCSFNVVAIQLGVCFSEIGNKKNQSRTYA